MYLTASSYLQHQELRREQCWLMELNKCGNNDHESKATLAFDRTANRALIVCATAYDMYI